MKPFADRKHEKMKEVLMDPSAQGPEVHYYMIRGGSDKRNITVWESGTVAGEYIKTYGHYHRASMIKDRIRELDEEMEKTGNLDNVKSKPGADLMF